jgi:hypothetical protein
MISLTAPNHNSRASVILLKVCLQLLYIFVQAEIDPIAKHTWRSTSGPFGAHLKPVYVASYKTEAWPLCCQVESDGSAAALDASQAAQALLTSIATPD